MDREFKRQRTQCIKNVQFAICEIAIESGPSDQEMIWTVDLTSYRVSGIANSRGKELNASRMSISRYAKLRLNLDRQIKK
jgi:hypothetical protein